MKTVKVTFLMKLNDDNVKALDYWLPENLNDHLVGDEEILDYEIITVSDDVERINTPAGY